MTKFKFLLKSINVLEKLTEDTFNKQIEMSRKGKWSKKDDKAYDDKIQALAHAIGLMRDEIHQEVATNDKLKKYRV